MHCQSVNERERELLDMTRHAMPSGAMLDSSLTATRPPPLDLRLWQLLDAVGQLGRQTVGNARAWWKWKRDGNRLKMEIWHCDASTGSAAIESEDR